MLSLGALTPALGRICRSFVGPGCRRVSYGTNPLFKLQVDLLERSRSNFLPVE